MARFFAVGFAFILMAVSLPAQADRNVSDPNSPGYYYGPDGSLETEEWSTQYTDCKPCQHLVDTYNSTMGSLLRLRFEIKNLEQQQREFNERWEERRERNRSSNSEESAGLSQQDQKGVANELNAIEKMNAEFERVPAMKQREKELTRVANNIAKQIEECEKQCKGGGEKRTWTDPAWDPDSIAGLPFAWQGPYPEVCTKCAKLSARLNELPGLAASTMARKENAILDLENTVQQIALIKLSSDFTTYFIPETNEKERRQLERDRAESLRSDLREQEQKKAALEDLIKRLDADLAEIKRNFEQTLELYNKCVPTCPKQTGAVTDPVKKDDCHYAALPERFIIGPNSEFGSGAAMKDKVKGMAGNALGSLMGGGGGVGLGGGFGVGGGRRVDDAIGTEATGGGRDAKGPPTEKDPTSGPWDELNFESRIRVDMRATGTTDGGLTFSGKIPDSSGDGTFHAAFLQDGSGNTITPKYHIYSLYYDWKLTVWWTYDHWTDGVHDYHDEDEEVTTGRNTIGSWKAYEGAENGVWSKFGFGNASKGIKGLGMEYDISKLDLACPLRMTTYITEPEADPVIATPVSTYLERVRNESGPSGEWKFINDMMVRGAKDSGGGGMQLIDPPLAPPPPPPP